MHSGGAFGVHKELSLMCATRKGCREKAVAGMESPRSAHAAGGMKLQKHETWSRVKV